ncbi:MAG TPA: PorV/PorQ family protein [Ignavibacteriaceae bacterium]|nr:PorV/PorQ family protein [Ignavibacteriaceae bacterium]
MKKILIIILFASVNLMFAQTFISDVSKKGTTAATFLNIGQGARAVAMGSAFVGAANDLSSIYWNPAGLAKLEGVGVMFEHTNWIADVKYNFVAASYNIGDFGTLGFSFTSSSIGEMNVTTIEEPNGTGETFTATDAAFSIAYAKDLTDNFSIGFNPKIVYQSLWKMNGMAFAIDLGVKYVTPFDGMILAMAISNFGTKMQITGNSNLVLHDLDPFNSGNNGKIPAYLETEQWALPLNFRVGVAYQPIRDDMHTVTIALDAAHPNDNYESINAGAEYTFNDFISIRGGYKALFLKDSEETFALGFGLKQLLIGNVAVKLDYAYQNFGRLSDIQKFTIGMTF